MSREAGLEPVDILARGLGVQRKVESFLSKLLSLADIHLCSLSPSGACVLNILRCFYLLIPNICVEEGPLRETMSACEMHLDSI